jgi:hypothetical protein
MRKSFRVFTGNSQGKKLVGGAGWKWDDIKMKVG